MRLFLSGKDDRCLRNSLVVWKLPARIWSLRSCTDSRPNSGGATCHRKTVVSNTGDDLDVIGVAFDAGMAVSTYCSFVRAKCSAAAAISQSAWRYGTERGGGNLRRSVLLQGSQMRTLPGEILLDFNLRIKRCSPIPFQNWRDARLMFNQTSWR